jgi:hippurate hydrolase
MHACGHDLHMAAWLATARIMAGARSRWSGTLVFIGQPGEEVGRGAAAMIADGLLTRFPKPDYVLAVHDDARLPAGVIGYRAGPVLSNADSVNVTIFGRGGHGARPETTVDPIVIASRFVLGLQTIVSRENSPFDPAVITVGSIHGGTKHNIIPDEVKLQLTVRSFTAAVRERLLAAIARQAKAEAAAAGAPKEPVLETVGGGRALVNDPALTERVVRALTPAFGASVQEAPQEMVSEDLSEFPHAGIPTVMLRIGAVSPAAVQAANKAGTPLPSLHSASYAPDLEPTLKAAIGAEIVSLRALVAPAASARR